MIALECAEWFDLQHNFLFRTEGQSTPSLLEYEVKQRDLHDNGRKTIKGGSRETNSLPADVRRGSVVVTHSRQPNPNGRLRGG